MTTRLLLDLIVRWLPQNAAVIGSSHARVLSGRRVMAMVLVIISVDSPSFMIRIGPVSLIDIVGVVSIHLGRFAIASETECWQGNEKIVMKKLLRYATTLYVGTSKLVKVTSGIHTTLRR